MINAKIDDNRIKAIERLNPDYDKLILMKAFFMKRPDRFLDFYNRDSNFSLFLFQRIFLRLIFILPKYFLVGVRGIGKTYICNLASMILSVLTPMYIGSIISPMKEQGGKIAQGSFEQILTHYPFFKNEIVLNEKGGYFQTDNGTDVIVFKNGSQLSIEFSKSQMRGLRKHWFILEEFAMPTFDYKKYESEIKPTKSNKRISLHGSVDKEEIQGRTGIITNANSPLSPAYKQLADIMGGFANGLKQMVFGADYRMSAMYGLLNIEEYLEAKYSPISDDPIDFQRNFLGWWIGGIENEIVDEQVLQSLYNIKYPVFKNNHKSGWRYVLAYDVASAVNKIENANCALVVTRFKYDDIINDYRIECVNVEHIRGLAYEDQANYLKKKAIDYDPDVFLVDINGLGESLVEWLLKDKNDGLGCWKFLYEDLFPHDSKDIESLKAWKMKENPNGKKIFYPLRPQGRFTKKIDMGIHIKSSLINRKVNFVDYKTLNGSNLPQYVLNYFNIQTNDDEEINNIRKSYLEFELLYKETRNITQNTDTKALTRVQTNVLKDRFETLQYNLWAINRLILNDMDIDPDYDMKEISFKFSNNNNNLVNRYQRKGGGHYQRKGSGRR